MHKLKLSIRPLKFEPVLLFEHVLESEENPRSFNPIDPPKGPFGTLESSCVSKPLLFVVHINLLKFRIGFANVYDGFNERYQTIYQGRYDQ